MKITGVCVRLVKNKDERLKAFCFITFDHEFVVRDIKVIEGVGGHFVAMPSRKMTDHCEKCGGTNHLKAKFCNNCGAALPENRTKKDSQGRLKLHADIAHPVSAKCRRTIQQRVVAAYKQECKRSAQLGYTPEDVDEADDDITHAAT